MTRAFLFPGQGSQFIGMGKDLAENFPAARLVFEEVDDSLGEPLSALCFQGEEETLKLTRNTQPALMAVSIAVCKALEGEGGAPLSTKASFVAGHSLGEYSALVSMGALSLRDGARLLRTRGEAMQQAVPVGEGAMTALIGLSLEQVEEVVQEASSAGILVSANDNAPGQVVISGAMAAVEKALGIAKDKGAKRALLLPVSAPFHSPLMEPAARVMKEALGAVSIQNPALPVIANVTAAPVQSAQEIQSLLVQQVCGAVRWRESVLRLAELGVKECVELGAGKVLTGLNRRIERSLETTAIGSVASVQEALETFYS